MVSKDFPTYSEEPHAPQIKRDTDIQQDVGGAYAGPFNEGEELKLVCEVHGGKLETKEALISVQRFFLRPTFSVSVLVRGRSKGGGQNSGRAWKRRGGQQIEIQKVRSLHLVNIH